jgi:hypothetical protein
MHRNLLLAAACAGLLVQGCSSRPRTFNPTLSAAAPGQPAFDQPAFDAAYATCNQLMVAGKLDSNGRLASGAAGAAAGGAMMAAGAGLATSAGMYTGAAIASATVVLIPFVAIGGAIGLAKVKRAKKEKAIKAAMGGCLRERGYAVASWDKAKKTRRAAAPATAAR